MRSQIRWTLTAVSVTILAMSVFVIGCSDDDETPVGPTSGSVLFSFDHVVGGQPLVLQSSTTVFPYTNAAGNPFNVDELEYFVSDFRLHRVDGTSVGVEDFLFREAEDDDTRSYTWAGVPTGTYTAVSFTYGLDAEKNVTGGLPILALEWPEDWGGGYHYMEMNGHYQASDGTTTLPYKLHTGRRFLKNANDPCPPACPTGPDVVAHHHYFEVKKSVAPFTVKGGETWEIVWTMDVTGWYEAPIFDMNTYFPTSMSGIMPHLEAQALLMQNGMSNVYSVVDAVKN